ncbi:MAG: Cys-tRNA(Pro) deacylase [Lachnospiraceae bacterium]|nr:Cys-tRNA(Pro) deacylase [Lachnospiraceae bacterium]
MAKEKETKTNAMRILEKEKLPYTAVTYECTEFIDGITIADKLGLPYERVYKTLVTVGKSKEHYVFVIPISEELDLKKAAKAVGEKSIEMIHVKELTPLTGYIRGGCTAIGMKKQFKTVVAEQAAGLQELYVSGGKWGVQLKLTPENYMKACRGSYADICV